MRKNCHCHGLMSKVKHGRSDCGALVARYEHYIPHSPGQPNIRLTDTVKMGRAQRKLMISIWDGILEVDVQTYHLSAEHKIKKNIKSYQTLGIMNKEIKRKPTSIISPLCVQCNDTPRFWWYGHICLPLPGKPKVKLHDERGDRFLCNGNVMK